MISFFRGPGGLRHRLACEFVPFWITTLGVGFAAAFLAWPWLVLLGVLLWLGASAGLRAIRARPRLRTIWRYAFYGHLLVWTALGIRAQHFDIQGAVGEVTSHAWSRAHAIRVGSASAAFDLPEGTTLAGWGMRPRRLALPPWAGLGLFGQLGLAVMEHGAADGDPAVPLFAAGRDVPLPAGPEVPRWQPVGARALVIRPEGDVVSDAPVAWVALDLVTCEAEVAAAIQARVAPLGIRPETLVVSATHTHSGPGGYSRQPLSTIAGTDHFRPDVFRAIVDAGVAAVTRAHAQAVPCSLGTMRLRDRDALDRPVLARNRRKSDPDRVDDRVSVLVARPTAGDGPAHALLAYPLHPILWRRHHMGFHRDLVDALEASFAQDLGAERVVFLNGAAGDVSPQSYGAVDPGLRVQAFVQRFRDAAWPDRQEGPPAARCRVRAARVAVHLPTPHALVALGNRTSLVPRRGALGRGGFVGALGDVVALPGNVVLWSSGFLDMRILVAPDALGVGVSLDRGVPVQDLHVGVIDLDLEDDDGRVQRVRLLWTPAEATTALGQTWRDRHGAFALVGYANGALGYAVTREEYDHAAYEARAAVFGWEGGARVGEALDRAVQTLDR